MKNFIDIVKYYHNTEDASVSAVVGLYFSIFVPTLYCLISGKEPTIIAFFLAIGIAWCILFLIFFGCDIILKDRRHVKFIKKKHKICMAAFQKFCIESKANIEWFNKISQTFDELEATDAFKQMKPLKLYKLTFPNYKSISLPKNKYGYDTLVCGFVMDKKGKIK